MQLNTGLPQRSFLSVWIPYFLFLALCLSHFAHAVEVGPTEDYRQAIANLSPGDELVLRGGLYELNGSFRISVSGTAANPVTVRAKTGEVPVFSMTTSNHNVLEVVGSSHLILRDIEFTGGSHGIRLIDSDYITIESCHVHDTGDVAISANKSGTYTGLQILRNHIHHTNGTGEGMYLGCNNDDCRVENSLIEGNYVHHTNGPTVSQGDGIELKEGSSGNVISHNVIHDTNYPGILTYSTVGNGAPNLIEGNVIWNTNDWSIQVAADAVLRNNISIGSGVGFQAHQAGTPSNIEFVHNTVIANNSGVNVRNVSGRVLIANNAVYARGGAAIRLISGNLSQVTVTGNVGIGGLSGGNSGLIAGNGIEVDFVKGFHGVPPMDLFPSVGSALIGAGSAPHGATLDFNGTARSGPPDAGAYHFNPAGNPGWVLNPAFKQLADDVVRPKPPFLYEPAR